MKRTPLFEAHRKLGGKLIEFGGWEMPVQYTSISDEHLAVRKAAGVFDISHMGEVAVTGEAAEAFLNQTLTNDIRKLAPGQGQYTLMCNDRGGVIDDLYVYRLGPEDFLLIINASRIEPDVEWLEQRSRSFGGTKTPTIRDVSNETGAIAIQGPKVADFIGEAIAGASVGGTKVSRIIDLKKNEVGRFLFAGKEILAARTGYTGEDGFEIVAPAELIESVWNRVLAVGQAHGLKPAGLGARDTLRTEMCYPLYGHELDENTTPIEAGVGFFVSFDKGEFVGRQVLAEQKTQGPQKKLAAFKMTDRSAPPRPRYPVWSIGPSGANIGQVVSGTQSPSLGIGIGLAYVQPTFAKAQTALEIEIRGKRFAAEVVPKPIYRKPD
jgi:aminomethyltransferase